ncbi:MAG: formylglycine-generating enzyme family protein [Leptospirales bacterium]|nr:formylglycine-generating enzyme family protein [Leptospirales bacterium]
MKKTKKCFVVILFVAAVLLPQAVYLQTKTPEGFVHVKGGSFMMGSPANEADRDDNEVQHKVTLSSFYMSKYEVTQAEWVAVMGENPSHFKGDNLPVQLVNWYDVVEYCNKRSIKEGLTPAYTIDKNQEDPNNKNDYDELKWTVIWDRNANGYRLPTEAEWEYACRAGKKTPFNTGNKITTAQANYNENRKNAFNEKTTPVGSFAPNSWGLYDMHGNVSEWCWDWYGEYSVTAQTNPTGAVFGSARVMRGGDLLGSSPHVRSAKRNGLNPSHMSGVGGFRVVRN